MEIPTVIKWAGGKKQLLEQFEKLYPEKFGNYYEPFLGSGAVFFQIRRKDLHRKSMYKEAERKYFLSDSNSDLIDLYKDVRDNVEKLIALLETHKEKHHKDDDYFYKVRNDYNKGSKGLERSAQFIYLNKTCFNGLYRENSKGEFNVPKGSYKNPAIVNEKVLREASGLLQGVYINCFLFQKTEKLPQKGDFIYLDPPYYPLSETASFTSYTKLDFSGKDQERLAEYFRKLDEKGCLLMLSNSDTAFIRKLYDGFNISTVYATRMINCQAEKRGKITEIVVRNYEYNNNEVVSL
jgi:DNA adenine methylase